MTGSKRTKAEQMAIAEKSRADYRKARIARLSNHTFAGDLPTPELVPGAIIDTTDNTLDKNFLEAPLDLILQEWENKPVLDTDVNTIELLLAHGPNVPVDAEEYKRVRILDIFNDEVFPITRLSIPKAELADDGQYWFRIRVTLINADRPFSDTLPFICDSREPCRPESPERLADLPTVPITDDYLAANNDEVTGKIPDYDWQPKDKVHVYIDNKVPEDPPQLPPVLSEVVTGQGQVVTLTGDMFKALGDGKAYIIYVLIDKAKNESRLSHIANVDVVLGPWPDKLQAPFVPLAAGAPDTVIDLKDAIEGVEVHIRTFENGKPTDVIEVTWGATALSPQLIGDNLFPIQVHVPNGVLLDEWDHSTVKKKTNVSYRVLRGGIEVGTAKIDIDVDFTYIGPPRPDPDPEWPNPINHDLTAPFVRGASEFPEINKLNRGDGGKPATLTFLMYTPLADKEEITFYWGQKLVDEATIQLDGTETSGQAYTVQIPWSYIESAGNGDVIVHYEISSPDTPNFQHSMPQTVIVDAYTLIPEKPSFLGVVEGWLNCTSLYVDSDHPHASEPGIRVEVPDLTRYGLKVGDKVTVDWVAISGREDSNNTPVPGTFMEVEITLDTADHPPTGFVWYVTPYDDRILPIYTPTERTARGRTRYSFQLSAGGEVFTSVTEEVLVGMFVASNPCQIPPPPKP